MEQKEKKKSSKFGSIFAIIAVTGLLIAFLCACIYTVSGCIGASTSIEELLHNQTEPNFATGKVYATSSCVSSMRHSVNGIIPLGTEYYYIIFLPGEDVCMTVKAPEDWEMDNFPSYYKSDGLMLNYNSDGVSVTGQVRKLNYKVRDNIADALNYHINANGRSFKMTDYYLDITASQAAWKGLIGFGLLLVSIIGFIMIAKKPANNDKSKSILGIIVGISFFAGLYLMLLYTFTL